MTGAETGSSSQGAERRSSDAEGRSVLKAVLIVLAVIGALAVLGVAGMALMHFLMMGGPGCC